MAKKQILLREEDLPKAIEKGVLANIIMKNASVLLGRPIGLKSDELKFQITNGHILHLPLAQIEEIWTTEQAD